VPNIVAGSFMVITSLKKLQIELSLGTIIISAILILSSLLISYAILFIPAIFSLWVVRTWGFYDSVVSSLMEFNNLPMQIYSKHIIRIGIFIVPVLVISNFPVLQLLDRMEPIYLVWAFIAPIILLFISRYFWQYAIKHYVSASS
jgi:ABC-2 type transport system permease protein